MAAYMDLTGKTALITGASSGIGIPTLEGVAGAGAECFIIARDMAKADRVVSEVKTKTGNDAIHILEGDFAILDDVRSAADAFLTLGKPLHLLINNAGITSLKRRETHDGYESLMAVNHLAPFLLTNLLLPAIKSAIIESKPHPRIVTVASVGHRWVRGINFDDFMSEKRYNGPKIYGMSKLANILFTLELAKKLEGTGITANCLHPGVVNTNIANRPENGFLVQLATTLAGPLMKTPKQGAATTLHCALSPKVENITGEYFDDCKIAKARPWAYDMDAAKKLWQVSEGLVGL